MLNPMLDKLSPMGNIKEMVSMLKSSGNPMTMMSQIAGQNPQMKQIMNMVGNGDPKQIFYSECQKRGVNPNDILNMLK